MYQMSGNFLYILPSGLFSTPGGFIAFIAQPTSNHQKYDTIHYQGEG